MIDSYLKKIKETYQRGDAREESYYSAFEDLINNFAEMKNKKDIFVTSQPKKTDAGNPDFRIWGGKHKIVGYIEAKPPDKQLDNFETSEQIKRYKSTFPNFILTNFIEFRLYREGIQIDEIRITDPTIFKSFEGRPSIKNQDEFANLLDKFFSFSVPSIKSAKQLAIELAKRTRFLRDEIIAEEIREEEKNESGIILGFYEAFQKYLIRGLTKERFANLYSQTITYGLFAARMRCKGEFNRKLAVYDIPHNIGILRDIFEYISLGDPPPQLEWIVDEISNVLANVDVKKIFSEFFRTHKGKDPVFHFYETFLKEYDPEIREQRGVYYTPEPVVSYIVHSLHILLKEKFGLKDGLADENVTILDPGGGTLTFVAEAINHAFHQFITTYGEGGKEEFIKEHILNNFYSFELMVAPYAIGHLKISFLLEELGYKLSEDERIKFYITNTLEKEEIEQTSLPGMASLAEESRKAGEVKDKIPILIILGNPPYSGESANKGVWITNLIEDYKQVDGQSLGEKNPKWLQDDYVKFIRFAEWKINQSGYGIIGYITNHSYLCNPTFRGMRQHLMNSFDEIYILDLHGNASKKEKCPDGSKDENVFDIMQGVSISFFIKKTNNPPNSKCNVYHSEIWGLRNKKYDWLSSNDINTTEWMEIHPHTSFYFLIPREEKYERLYNKFWSVTEIFPANSVGIVTARDKLTIHNTPEEVLQVIQDFSSLPEEQARVKYNLGQDVRDWKVKLAQEDLKISGLDKNRIVPILYRPFDLKYTYYTGKSCGFHCMPRSEIMNHMLKENLGLVTVRQVAEGIFNHSYVSNSIVESRITLSNKGIGYIFPLYIYSNNERSVNINQKLFSSLYSLNPKESLSEDIFYYVYTILFSPKYRELYVEYLTIDFPKIPITENVDVFNKMAEFGKKLVDLHLLKSPELRTPIAKFQGDGDNTIETIKYNEEGGRIYINKTQHFEVIENDVWEYQMDGYQVLHKWLKDRKKRKLSLEEIKHYCKVVTAINKTIKLQEKIDELYPKIEKNLLKYQEKKTVSLKEYLDD